MKRILTPSSLVFGFFLLLFFSFSSCKSEPKKTTASPTLFFEFSLAQWSFNKSFREGGISPYEFAKMANELGFKGLEYVSQLYPDVIESDDKDAAIQVFVEKNNALAAQYQMKNVLIMIDEEGNLSSSNEKERMTAIENHKKWIAAAHQMGCSAVRLNLYGEKDPEKWIANSIKSLKELSDYGSERNINVIVENHGRITSNIPFLMRVINDTQKANCGTLPDFGNFCIAKDGYGSLSDGSCKEVYDPYIGVAEMMPKAFGVSAKSYDFDADGNETTLDYYKLLSIVKEAGYNGFIGVEYEGHRLSEQEGILATKKLLENVASKL